VYELTQSALWFPTRNTFLLGKSNARVAFTWASMSVKALAILAILCPLIIVHVVSPVTVEHPAVVVAAPMDDADVMLTEAHDHQLAV